MQPRVHGEIVKRKKKVRLEQVCQLLHLRKAAKLPFISRSLTIEPAMEAAAMSQLLK
jgi:hypothetical protein